MRRGLTYFYVFLMALTVLVVAGASSAIGQQLALQQRNEYLRSIFETKDAFRNLCSSSFSQDVTLVVPSGRELLIMGCDRVLSATQLDYSPGSTIDAKSTGYFFGDSVLGSLKETCRNARGCSSYEVCLLTRSDCNPYPCNTNVVFSNTVDTTFSLLGFGRTKTTVNTELIKCSFPVRASGVFAEGQYRIRLSATSVKEDREVILEHVV